MSENVNGALTYILIEQRGNERQQTDGDNIANGGGQRRGQIVRIQAILLREQNHSDKHKVCNEYTWYIVQNIQLIVSSNLPSTKHDEVAVNMADAVNSITFSK